MSPYYILLTCVACASLLSAAVGAGIAWGSLTQRQTSHEQRDTERFEEQSKMLQEIRSDVKTILTTR